MTNITPRQYLWKYRHFDGLSSFVLLYEWKKKHLTFFVLPPGYYQKKNIIWFLTVCWLYLLSLPHAWYSEYSRNLGKSLLNTIKKNIRPYLIPAELRKSGYLKKGIVCWTQGIVFSKSSIRLKKKKKYQIEPFEIAIFIGQNESNSVL